MTVYLKNTKNGNLRNLNLYIMKLSTDNFTCTRITREIRKTTEVRTTLTKQAVLMNQRTLSGRSPLGFEPIRRGFGGLGVVLQHHAEEEGWPLFGVFTAQQRIPVRLLKTKSNLYIIQNRTKKYIFYWRSWISLIVTIISTSST